MSFKSVGIMMLMMAIFYLIFNNFGIGMLTAVTSILTLIHAIVFSVKSEYYDRYLIFMNPKLYTAYCEKHSSYIKKNRKREIVYCYISSAILGVNALIQLNSGIDARDTFSTTEIFVSFVIVFVVGLFLLNPIQIFVIKKSKSYDEYLIWNNIVGVVTGVILIAIAIIYLFVN